MAHMKKFSDKWHQWHDKYDNAKRKFKSRLPKQGHLKESRAYKLLGSTLLRREYWCFRGRPLARGLALGIFVAFTPTIGAQMLICCLLIPFFPGNLPIALAACWLTNPVTAAPIYYAEYLVGKWLLALVGYVPEVSMEEGMTLASMSDVGGTLWFGSMVVSLILGFGSFYAARWFLAFERDVRLDKHRYHRRRRKQGAATADEPGDR